MNFKQKIWRVNFSNSFDKVEKMLRLEVECEKTHLVCDTIPGVVKDGQSEELWLKIRRNKGALKWNDLDENVLYLNFRKPRKVITEKINWSQKFVRWACRKSSSQFQRPKTVLWKREKTRNEKKIIKLQLKMRRFGWFCVGIFQKSHFTQNRCSCLRINSWQAIKISNFRLVLIKVRQIY